MPNTEFFNIINNLLSQRARERELEKERGLELFKIETQERNNLLQLYDAARNREDALNQNLTELTLKYQEAAGIAGEKGETEGLSAVLEGIKKRHPIKTDAENVVGIAKKNIVNQIYDTKKQLQTTEENIREINDRIGEIVSRKEFAQAAGKQFELQKEYRSSQIEENLRQARDRRDHTVVENINALQKQIDAHETTIAQHKNFRGQVDYKNADVIKAVQAKKELTRQLNLLSTKLSGTMGINIAPPKKQSFPISGYKIAGQ